LSTHDTKRSGDVRARLNLLSEIPEEWESAVRRWAEHNDRYRTQGYPDRNLEYLAYQTLVSAWPIDGDRLTRFLQKAAREAKVHTSWINPVAAYEDGVAQFVAGVTSDAEFRTDVESFLGRHQLVALGRIASLAQTTLLLTCPGVPDIYQGSELWTLSLVDPDNRQSVDFEAGQKLLIENDYAAAPKLWLILRVFREVAPQSPPCDRAGGRRITPTTQLERGWWEASHPDAQTGSRYGFSLDGGEPRPDPRSPSQPDGVLGLSQLVDHSAFAWSDSAWRGRPLAGSILYELHIGTFSPRGTFDGAIEHIPHLVELGVDTVELMPVPEFSGDHGWGYDGVDLFAPHHAYGGPDGLKRLVDACHSKGLAVVLDVVYNHLGPAGNFLPEFGPYLSTRHQTFWGPALNFDGPGSDEVRRYVIDNVSMWVRDYHVDGLRLDAVHVLADQ